MTLPQNFFRALVRRTRLRQHSLSVDIFAYRVVIYRRLLGASRAISPFVLSCWMNARENVPRSNIELVSRYNDHSASVKIQFSYRHTNDYLAAITRACAQTHFFFVLLKYIMYLNTLILYTNTYIHKLV